jgi:protein LTV1
LTGEIEKINFEDLEEEEVDPICYEKLRIAKQNQTKTAKSLQPNTLYEEEEDADDIASNCASVQSGRSEQDDDFDDRYTYRSAGSKSQFTSYSMSSSILPRNRGLTDLDEQFENFYLNDYADDTEIGDLGAERDDHDELNDNVDRNVLNQIVNQGYMFEKDEKFEINTDIPKEIILKIAAMQDAEESDEEETEEIELQAGMGKNDYDSRWDCESVLSTYSTLYNHPKLICESQPRKLRINPKTGVPEGVVGSQLSAKALKQLGTMSMLQQDLDMQSVRSTASMMSHLTVRNEQETPEERRQRKKNLKEYMKERRMEKKMNKEAFKAEHLRQQKESITNRTVGAMKMV